MSMFENFPYTDLHNLNLDWIIKIAKDFLDQYTHLQELITNGEESLQNLTESGLESLQNKADELEALLNAWYSTHSEDIANQLVSALASITTKETAAIANVDSELASALAAFNTQAEQKAAETIASIPADYTQLANKVAIAEDGIILNYADQEESLNKTLNMVRIILPFQHGRYLAGSGFNDNVQNYARNAYPYPAGTFRIRGYLFTNIAVQYDTDNQGTALEDGYTQGERIITATGPWYITMSGTNNFTSSDLINMEKLFIVEQLNTYNQRIITDYQTGRYIGSGYNAVTSYARNSIPFPAGNYIVRPYAISNRPYRYSTDSTGIALTNGWSIGTYYVNATSIWYINFNKDGSFSQADLDNIKENFIIERIPDITIEQKVTNAEIESKLQLFPTGSNLYAATLTANDKMIAESNSIMKNQRVEFSAKISTMGSIAVGHGETRDGIYIIVDDTNVQFANNGTTFRTVPHNLTIADYITVIMEVDAHQYVSTTILTRSGIFTDSVQVQSAWANNVFAQCVSGTFSNCRITWQCDDYDKPIWLFGDSYFSLYANTRWTYYVVNQLGYENFLMNAHPGMNSTLSYTELLQALKHSTPRYLVWCIGMNDPDTASAVNETWKSTVENIMSICAEKGITLILSTVPVVEDTSYNNEFKNAYVSNSGYHYIDFANAVYGISNWSNDGLHPNADGARILAMKALAEFPQLMQK